MKETQFGILITHFIQLSIGKKEKCVKLYYILWSSKSEADVTQAKGFQERAFMRESNEMAETKLALDELVVLLGAKQNNEKIELKDFLLILKKDAFS